LGIFKYISGILNLSLFCLTLLSLHLHTAVCNANPILETAFFSL
jgi:hypothetical protein